MMRQGLFKLIWLYITDNVHTNTHNSGLCYSSFLCFAFLAQTLMVYMGEF